MTKLFDTTNRVFDATAAEWDAATAELDATTAELETNIAELDATIAKLDATTAELDKTAAAFEPTRTAELDERQCAFRSGQQLAARMSAAVRAHGGKHRNPIGYPLDVSSSAASLPNETMRGIVFIDLTVKSEQFHQQGVGAIFSLNPLHQKWAIEVKLFVQLVQLAA